MRLVGLAVLAVLLGACADGCRPRTSIWFGIEPGIDVRVAHYHALLQPFERARLTPFGAENEVARYFDRVAQLQTRGVERILNAPPLPEPPPRRMRADDALRGADNRRHMFANGMLGNLYGPAPEQPALLARSGDRLFVVEGDRLHAFAIDATGHALRPLSSLAIGAPLPVPTTREVALPEGGHATMGSLPEGALSAVTLFHHLFATERGLVLLGTRFETQELEILRIAIGPDGRLQRGDSTFLHFEPAQVDTFRARFTGGRLAIYFRHDPFFQLSPGSDDPLWYSLPSIASSVGAVDGRRPLLSASGIYQPLLHAFDTYLHVVALCDVAAPSVSCRARAIPGPSAAAIEVDDRAAFLWFVAWRGERTPTDRALIVRFPFDGSEPGALRVRGQPPPVSGMLRTSPTHLYAVRAPEPRSALELLSLPVAAFTPEVPEAPAGHSRSIRPPEPDKFDPQTVALTRSHLVWGTRGGGYMQWNGFARTLLLTPLAGGQAHALPIDHAATMLCELGDRLLVVGSDSWNLQFSLIALDSTPRLAGRYTIKDAARAIAGEGLVTALDGIADSRWVATEISLWNPKGPPAQTLLPLHVDEGAQEMLRPEDLPLWSLPRAERSLLHRMGTEFLALDSELLVVHAERQLVLLHFAPNPVEAQRIAL